MKFLIVTSEVTFVKENYNDFLESLFKTYKDPNLELVILKNNGPLMVIKGLGLILLGARITGLNLITNSLKSIFLDHEKIASKFGIKTRYYKSANDDSFIEYVIENKIDLIINARTRNIYKEKILNAPKLGCINIHHGLLPDNRGTMCDLYALYNDRPAGFSIHKMEKKIDNGGIIEVVPVTDVDSPIYRDFPEHIYQSSIIEGKTLGDLLIDIEKNKQLPIMKENKSKTKIYTKNPDRLMIKKMIQKGIRL